MFPLHRGELSSRGERERRAQLTHVYTVRVHVHVVNYESRKQGKQYMYAFALHSYLHVQYVHCTCISSIERDTGAALDRTQTHDHQVPRLVLYTT